MSHNHEPIQPLDSGADLRTVITKLNEIIEHLNWMWWPEEDSHP